MNSKLIELSLIITTFLSGLYGGVGFFTIMGGNPAIKLMGDKTFAEFWQHIDHYMGSRMPVFGPILLISLLLSIILLIPERGTPSFWCMLLAFVIIIGDLAFTLSTNHPLNSLIQSWDLNNLPANVQEVKWKVVNAFGVRLWLMISAFGMVLLSVWLRNKS